MARLKLLAGPAHPNKINTEFQLALERIDSARQHSFLWLVPSRWQARQLSQRLLHMSSSHLLIQSSILTLDEWISSLSSAAPKPAFPTAFSRLFIEDALSQDRASELTGGQAVASGLADSIDRLFHDLEHQGTRAEDLPSQSTREKGLRTLYASFLRRIEQHWHTTGQVLRTVSPSHLVPTPNRDLRQLELLIVSGFNAWPSQAQSLFDAFTPHVEEIHVVLDFEEERPQLYAQTASLYQFFKARAAHTQVYAATEPHAAKTIATQLFNRSDNALCEASIRIHSGDDRLEEVVYIARQIRHLASEQNVPLSSIRIAFANLNHYLPLLYEVLPQHGIPFHHARGISLAVTPLSKIVHSILDAVLENYSRRSLLRLLSLPWISLLSTDGTPFSLEIFDAWARNLPPTEGRNGWLQAVDRRSAYLERERAILHGDGPLADEIDDPEQRRQDLEIDLEALRPLRGALENLFTALRPFERSLTIDAFRRSLLAAFSAFGVLRHLEQHASAPDKNSAPSLALAHTYFTRLLDDFCATAPALKRQRWSLRELSSLLRAAMNRTFIPPDKRTGVEIVDLRDNRSISCEFLFLGGLVEGEFPRPFTTDLFFNEDQRQALSLGNSENVNSADRLLFYQACCTPRQHLFLTHPRREGNTALNRSPFVEEVATQLHNISLQALETGPLNEAIFTRADLHRAIGLGLSTPKKEGFAAHELLTLSAVKVELYPALYRLQHGLVVEGLRNSLDGLSPYEGIIADETTRTAISNHLGPHRVFSTTQFETYSRCPFRFFADRLLNIKSLEDPEADTTAIDRGNLVHRILFHFYDERRGEDGVRAVTPDGLDQALLAMRRIGHREAEAMKLGGFFWQRELVRLLGGYEPNSREGVIERFLRLEAEASEPASPTHFELSFGSYEGMGPRDPHSSSAAFTIEEQGQTVRLFGKIDRIDRTADGRFIVYDYKTGHPPRVSDIARGLNLQLPLYLLAVESLLGESGLEQGMAAAYLLLRDLEECGRSALFADEQGRHSVYTAASKRGLLPHDAFRQTLAELSQHVASYAASMRSGLFHVTTHEPTRICPHCPYAQSCRLDPRRMRTLKREGQLK